MMIKIMMEMIILGPVKAFLLAPLSRWPVLAVMIIIRMMILIYKIMMIMIMIMTKTMKVTMSMVPMTIMKIPNMKPIKAFLLAPLAG